MSSLLNHVCSRIKEPEHPTRDESSCLESPNKMCFVWGSLGGGIQGLMHIAYLYKPCSICKSCKICEFELNISNQNGFKSTSFTTVSSFQIESGRQGDKQVHSIIQTAVALSMKLTQMRHATFYRFSMYNTEMCHH